MADRKSLQTYVTAQAHQGWHEWCANEGVSFSALLEAVGACLAANDDHPVSESLQGFCVEARQIDASRRRRTLK